MEVIQLIKLSPKRQVIFETVRSQQESPASQSIHLLCPTRWTVRTGAMQAIVAHYEALYSTMEAFSHGTDDCCRRAREVLDFMDRFSTFFGVKLSILIFSIIKQLSVSLQGINTTVNDCYSAMEVGIRVF